METECRLNNSNSSNLHAARLFSILSAASLYTAFTYKHDIFCALHNFMQNSFEVV